MFSKECFVIFAPRVTLTHEIIPTYIGRRCGEPADKLNNYIII